VFHRVALGAKRHIAQARSAVFTLTPIARTATTTGTTRATGRITVTETRARRTRLAITRTPTARRLDRLIALHARTVIAAPCDDGFGCGLGCGCCGLRHLAACRLAAFV
jgi:hypothetical protein